MSKKSHKMFPESPVLPQLSVDLESLFSSRRCDGESKGDLLQSRNKTDEQTDGKRTLSSSSSKGKVPFGRRLVTSIDISSMRIKPQPSTQELEHASSSGGSHCVSKTASDNSYGLACGKPVPAVVSDYRQCSCVANPWKYTTPDKDSEATKPVSSQLQPATIAQTKAESAVMVSEIPQVLSRVEKEKGISETVTDNNNPTLVTAWKATHALETHKALPSIEVNGHSYVLLKELGRGGSSKVYEVYDTKNSISLAIKCVNLKAKDKSVCEGYLNEINLLKKLQGSIWIVKLFDYEYNVAKEKLFVVMEKADVDLATIINRTKDRRITPEMIKYYWSEMLRAVQEVHQMGIIHLDLKPANFVLVAGQLKLIDFGIASAIPDGNTSIIKDTKCGTLSYMSPEALLEVQDAAQDSSEARDEVRIKLRMQSDVWSLGCILYHMVYGRTPFQHIKNNLRLQALVDPSFNVDFPPIGNRLLLDVLKRCIVRDYSQRATVQELLTHSYLSSEEFSIHSALHHRRILLYRPASNCGVDSHQHGDKRRFSI